MRPNEHPIVVVSNQSGIGRGYFDEKAHADLTRWMCNRFEAERTAIAHVYHCPYHPLHGNRRVPRMILQAVSDLRLDFARCVIVGDQMSDIEAGMAAGLGLRILLAARPGERKEGAPSHEVVADLSEVLALLRSRFATTAAVRRSGPS